MKTLIKAILYAIVVIILASGVGNMINGLRAAVRPEPPPPLQPPGPEPLPQREAQPQPPENVLPDPHTEDRAMFRALCLWEHRGVIRIDDVSEAGAVGPAQITPVFLKDMNIHLKTCYTLADCKDYEVAYRLTTEYWAKYGLRTDEERARCHLAGPRAMTRKSVWAETTEYWAGVQTYLK